MEDVDKKYSVLSMAAEAYDVKLVKGLVEIFSDLDMTDSRAAVIALRLTQRTSYRDEKDNLAMIDCVEFMASRGVNPMVEFTPPKYGQSDGSNTVFKNLISGGKISAAIKVARAANIPDEQITSALREKPQRFSYNQRPDVFSAAAKEGKEAFRQLLDLGFSPNEMVENLYGNAPMFFYATDPDTLRMLVDEGANMLTLTKDRKGYPEHLSGMAKSKDRQEMLTIYEHWRASNRKALAIEPDAQGDLLSGEPTAPAAARLTKKDMDDLNRSDRAAITKLVVSGAPKTEIKKNLKASGISLHDFRSEHGYTIFGLSLAAKRFPLMGWLLDQGFNPATQKDNNGILEVTQLFRQRGYSQNKKAQNWKENIEVVERLVPKDWKDPANPNRTLLDEMMEKFNPDDHVDPSALLWWHARETPRPENHSVTKIIISGWVGASAIQSFLKKQEGTLGPLADKVLSAHLRKTGGTYWNDRDKKELEQFLIDFKESKPELFREYLNPKTLAIAFLDLMTPGYGKTDKDAKMGSSQAKASWDSIDSCLKHCDSINWDESFSYVVEAMGREKLLDSLHLNKDVLGKALERSQASIGSLLLGLASSPEKEGDRGGKLAMFKYLSEKFRVEVGSDIGPMALSLSCVQPWVSEAGELGAVALEKALLAANALPMANSKSSPRL